MCNFFRFLRCILLFASACFPTAVLAEQPDSLVQYTFEPYVVTANRYKNHVTRTGSSVHVMQRDEIKQFPAVSLASILSFMPGLHVVSYDGMGLEPVVGIRGFHGGGQAEYLTVLVDGIPVNDPLNGMANWNLLPLHQIERIELLRGGASALYGDAAMGGVLNLISEDYPGRHTRVSFSAGNHQTLNMHVGHSTVTGKGHLDLYVSRQQTKGFRPNSQWRSFSWGAKFMVPLTNRSVLTIQSINNHRKRQLPGPLIAEDLRPKERETIASKAEDFFMSDKETSNSHMLNARLSAGIDQNNDIQVSASWSRKNTDRTDTYVQPPLIISPIDFIPAGPYDTTMFGNTKNRITTSDQLLLRAELFSRPNGGNTNLLAGIDLDIGYIDNRANNLFMGFEADYTYNKHPVSELDFKGHGYRLKPGLFLSGDLAVSERLSVATGLRYDMLADRFGSDFPVKDTTLNKTYHAISPKIWVNLITGLHNHHSGNLYASYSRAFKAPTVDQRTDLKALHYAMFFQLGQHHQLFIHQASPFSNADLKPQKSNNYELGTYQMFALTQKMNASLHLATYLIQVTDEIDFDLQALQYRNIQSSRHLGIESSIRVDYKNQWFMFCNGAFSEATFASGTNKGNQLKGVPLLTYAAGLGLNNDKGFGGSLLVNGTGNLFLDDENTEQLPSHYVLSSRLSYHFKKLEVSFNVNNLLNQMYFTTGYILYGHRMVYPIAGIQLAMAVSISF